jgi:hypothetical protein
MSLRYKSLLVQRVTFPSMIKTIPISCHSKEELLSYHKNQMHFELVEHDDIYKIKKEIYSAFALLLPLPHRRLKSGARGADDLLIYAIREA